MENEDTKYSDRAKQVEENVINKSKMVEEFVVSGIDTIVKFITDISDPDKFKKDKKSDN
jgi:pyruvate carboxylase